MRDGISRAETGACDYRFGVLGLETSVQLKMVDCVEFLSGSRDLWVWVPFQECLVWPQAEILQRRENPETRTSHKVLTFLKSFKDDETEPAAVDRSCGLEDFIILFTNDLNAVQRARRDGVWVFPRSAFIDFQFFLGDY